jgi:hypothetical protein
LRILLCARGFVRGNLREPGDAFGLFIVRFRQRADLGLERAEQLEQLAFAFFADGVRAANLRLNFANGFFDHGFRPKIKHCREFGKDAEPFGVPPLGGKTG